MLDLLYKLKRGLDLFNLRDKQFFLLNNNKNIQNDINSRWDVNNSFFINNK